MTTNKQCDVTLHPIVPKSKDTLTKLITLDRSSLVLTYLNSSRERRSPDLQGFAGSSSCTDDASRKVTTVISTRVVTKLSPTVNPFE